MTLDFQQWPANLLYSCGLSRYSMKYWNRSVFFPQNYPILKQRIYSSTSNTHFTECLPGACAQGAAGTLFRHCHGDGDNRLNMAVRASVCVSVCLSLSFWVRNQRKKCFSFKFCSSGPLHAESFWQKYSPNSSFITLSVNLKYSLPGHFSHKMLWRSCIVVIDTSVWRRINCGLCFFFFKFDFLSQNILIWK